MTSIAIYSEQKWRPQTEDIFKELFLTHPEITEVYEYNEFLDPDVPVLVLGHLPPGAVPLHYRQTLSQAQIVSTASAVTELEAALTLLLTPMNWPEVPYTVVTGLLTPFQEAAIGKIIAVDIETGGGKDKLPWEMWLLSVAIYDGSLCYVWSEEALRDQAVLDQLWRILTARDTIAHNGTYDFRQLSYHLHHGVIRGNADTILMHHALNLGAKERGLKPLARKYLGAPDWDAAIDKYVGGQKRYELVPREELYEYNAGDVIWTWRLYWYFLPAFSSSPRLTNLALHEFKMGRLFQDIEMNGIGIDPLYLDKLDKMYTEQYAAALEEIRQFTDDPKFNPNSSQQVQRYLHSKGNKVPSTGEKVLKEFPLNAMGKQFVELMFRCRKITKMHGTYVKGILKRQRENVVYPSYKVFGTNTGRLSSVDPNIQNIPRDEEGKLSLRRIFVPRNIEHRSLVAVDYSQAELRVMACLSNDEYLISLFQPGMPDFFDSLMPTAFVNDDISSWDKATKKNKRAQLKSVVYGLAYNRKAAAIATELGITRKEAQTIINNFLKGAPQFAEWREDVIRRAVDPDGVIITPFGRQFQAEIVTDKTKQNIINSALSFLPQSTASDICVTAAFEVHARLPEFDSKIVATVHDSIVMEVPDIYINEVTEFTMKYMTGAGAKVFKQVPFATDPSFGKSWEGI